VTPHGGLEYLTCTRGGERERERGRERERERERKPSPSLVIADMD